MPDNGSLIETDVAGVFIYTSPDGDTTRINTNIPPGMERIVTAARAAFMFNYHRDLMSAVVHLDAPRFSAITVQLAEALATAAGAMSEEIGVVIRTSSTAAAHGETDEQAVERIIAESGVEVVGFEPDDAAVTNEMPNNEVEG